MKQLHIYIKAAEVLAQIESGLHNLENQGLQLCVHNLPENFFYVMSDRERLMQLGLSDWKESLYLTDIPQFAALLGSGKYPVLAYLHEGNRDQSFGNVGYVIEGFEDVTAEYFIRVWQRMTGQPWHILDTERCSVRETTVEDVDAFYELYREPSITEYMENLFSDPAEERAYIETYIEKVYGFYGFGMWTVVWKETGQVIGRAGISMREGFRDPELGFMIGVPWQGQGVAGEVCRGILRYAGEELDFRRVQALVRPGNEKSVKLLKGLGFTDEGEVEMTDGTYRLYIAQ